MWKQKSSSSVQSSLHLYVLRHPSKTHCKHFEHLEKYKNIQSIILMIVLWFSAWFWVGSTCRAATSQRERSQPRLKVDLRSEHTRNLSFHSLVLAHCRVESSLYESSSQPVPDMCSRQCQQHSSLSKHLFTDTQEICSLQRQQTRKQKPKLFTVLLCTLKHTYIHMGT